MAVITPVASTVAGQGNLAGWKVVASNLANTSDTCSAITFPDYSDRSVVVSGAFGTGGALTIEGTNDGTNWSQLSDPQGNLISFTGTAIKAITEACVSVRAKCVSSDGTTTSMIATFFFRKTSQP